ncbi:MAG: phosphotransferase [Chloroflexi bacterium]|nr:phosphotransferase [Chloroflexota bacterium]
MEIPEKYEDVTAAWLTAALREGGVISDATVTGFTVDPLGADRSRTSSLARIELTYAGPSDGLPRSLFAKFVSRIPGNRALVAEMDLFRNEIELYRNLGDEIPLDMPRLYYGASSNDTDLAVLLLEEIDAMAKPADVPIEQNGLTEGEGTLALTRVAQMHTEWWENTRLRELSWLQPIDSSRRNRLYDAYPDSWEKLKPVVEKTFTPAGLDICDRLEGLLPTVRRELGGMPETLCHGDYHGGNMLWDRLGTPTRVWALDWQIPTRGPAIMDVGWFLSLGLNVGDVGLLRSLFLPSYHRALESHGLESYPYEQLLSDYRFAVLDSLARAVSLFAILDFAREDATEIPRVLLGRATAAAEEMGCTELLR